MSKIIAIALQKGGTGKTTTSTIVDTDTLMGGNDKTGLLERLADRIIELREAEYPGMKVCDDEPVCFYCDRLLSWEDRRWSWADDVAIQEHVFAKANGGTNRKHNLVWACRKCNVEKGVKHPLDWLSEYHDVDDMTAMEFIARLILEYHIQLVTISDLDERLYSYKQQLLTLAQTISNELGNGGENEDYSDS